MASETFLILGQFAPRAFLPWIERHGRRLGLSVEVAESGAGRLSLRVAGPPDLLDAMEMGCLLGPREVWVEEIARGPFAAPE